MNTAPSTTARRTKTIALSGLLAALALTVSGCSTLPASSEAPAGSSPPAAQPEAPERETIAESVATFGFIEDQNFREPTETPVEWYYTEAEVEDLKATSLALFPILVEDHPEFTVEGFTPTPEVWNETVAPKLQPLTTPAGFERLSAAWNSVLTEDKTVDEITMEFNSNPVLTNKPDMLHNTSGGPAYTASSTWKSDNGEVCSPSSKPYGINEPGINLSSWYGETHLNAISELQMDVIVHCKEGGQLSTRVSLYAYLARDVPGGKFLLENVILMKTPGGTSVLTK